MRVDFTPTIAIPNLRIPVSGRRVAGEFTITPAPGDLPRDTTKPILDLFALRGDDRPGNDPGPLLFNLTIGKRSQPRLEGEGHDNQKGARSLPSDTVQLNVSFVWEVGVGACFYINGRTLSIRTAFDDNPIESGILLLGGKPAPAGKEAVQEPAYGWRIEGEITQGAGEIAQPPPVGPGEPIDPLPPSPPPAPPLPPPTPPAPPVPPQPPLPPGPPPTSRQPRGEFPLAQVLPAVTVLAQWWGVDARVTQWIGVIERLSALRSASRNEQMAALVGLVPFVVELLDDDERGGRHG